MSDGPPDSSVPAPPASTRLRDLLDRLARVVASEGWRDDLNPTQRAALLYLTRPNRFSRAPSHVADYLLATRGTVSQTLKALARKGLVEEVRSDADRRSFSYEATAAGRALAKRHGAVDAAAENLGDTSALEAELTSLLRAMLAEREQRSFGVCATCRHHRSDANGVRCALLGVTLQPLEATQLCHEHEVA